MWYVYANAHSSAREHTSYVVACIVFLYMKISACFIKQAACLQLFPNLGGGDNSILWLSIKQTQIPT
jgi:hypothetical protein